MGVAGIERRERIRRMIAERGTVSIAELVSLVRVSEVTARRYLAELEAEGVCLRTYGGAVRAEPALAGEFFFDEKAKRRIPEKRAIAAAADPLVEEGSVVFLDSGTTTLELARRIRASGRRATVVTTSLPAAIELIRAPRVSVVTAGGVVRRELCDVVGPFPNEESGRLSFATAFLGVDGISARAGLTTTDPATAAMEKAVIARSRRVVVLADASKVGRVSLIPYAEIAALPGPAHLITDAGAPAAEVRALKKLMTVTIAEVPAAGKARRRTH